ncbi:MAG: YihY/virulence factor BrkB family protein, partial [Acidimicrobiales bacterium]|nr:YihY/virulence factor BrkB family protein [Acidimicrobiales bacterium]
MNEPAAGLEDAASGLWSSIERRWNAGMDVIDRVQRRRKPTAFVVGVLKRFAEDRGVQLGALIAYYGLLSIFPLMVVLLTVAGFVFDSRPDLRADLERTVLQQFPTMGPTIRQNTQAIRGNFVSLVLGLAGAVWAGLAAVNAAEVALNGIYNVARHERPNPIKRRLKSLRMLLILGLGVLASVMVANLGRVVDGLGGLQAVWLACASIGINTALYALAYRSLVSADLSWRS